MFKPGKNQNAFLDNFCFDSLLQFESIPASTTIPTNFASILSSLCRVKYLPELNLIAKKDRKIAQNGAQLGNSLCLSVVSLIAATAQAGQIGERNAMSKIVVAALVATAIFWPHSVLAQQPAGPPVGPDFSKVEIKTTDLGNRTYMLEGFGGNSTIAVGDDGVIMIDGQFAPLHDKLKAAIAAVTPQPVRFLVNTHYHRDHVGGNVPFGK